MPGRGLSNEATHIGFQLSPQTEVWITIRSASVEASSEPGSEFSFLAGSGNDLSTVHQIVSTKGSVLGDFEVHESIGVRSNMADSGCRRPHAQVIQ